MIRNLHARLAGKIGGRDLLRLLLLLVPLSLYDFVLSVSLLPPTCSPPEVVVVSLSSVLFCAGYATFWFGVFALSSGRIFRWAAGTCLSLSAIFLITLGTAGAVYSQEFGTTLGYGVLSATVSQRPDEFYDLRKDSLERDNLAEKTSTSELEKLRAAFLNWQLKTMAMYG